MSAAELRLVAQEIDTLIAGLVGDALREVASALDERPASEVRSRAHELAYALEALVLANERIAAFCDATRGAEIRAAVRLWRRAARALWSV